MEMDFARLVSATGETYELRRQVTKIGRAPDNDIILLSNKESRYHAEISYVKNGFVIKDLASKNGTKVNNEKLEPNIGKKMFNSDKIRFGLSSLEYTFFELDTTQTAYNTVEPGISPPLANLEVDTSNLRVKIRSGTTIKTVDLEGLQWKLFYLLYQNRNTVCNREDIIDQLYQTDDPNKLPSPGAFDTLVSRLRLKLEMFDADKLPYIRTIRGHGYRLEV
jgi:FHA domain/Transcriptional regulatory protein, C terminal